MSKKFIVFLLIAIGVVIITFATILCIYSIPYVKINQAIVYVNKNDVEISGLDVNDWISPQDFKKLDIVEQNISPKNAHVEIDTHSVIKSFSYNKLIIRVDITAKVRDLETFEIINCYSQTRTISCSFNHLKWTVDCIE